MQWFSANRNYNIVLKQSEFQNELFYVEEDIYGKIQICSGISKN